MRRQVFPPVGSSDAYRSYCRYDVLDLVPEDARNVLSVGCGVGATEEQLVERGVRVVGIEIDPTAARAAAGRGVEVIEGDATAMGERLARERFDCLIYADVLEHLADPAALLEAHCRLLAPGGSAIVSVPNFRHHSVFRQLFLRGVVEYADSGILDRTHLRLTTRKLVERWMSDAGLVVDHREYISLGRCETAVAMLSGGLAREFVAKQVLVRGRKRSGTNGAAG